MTCQSRAVPDAAYPGMWRVQWPDDRRSDMVNLTRAKDAAACFTETEERRQRGRQSLSEGRLCVKTRGTPTELSPQPTQKRRGKSHKEYEAWKNQRRLSR